MESGTHGKYTSDIGGPSMLRVIAKICIKLILHLELCHLL